MSLLGGVPPWSWLGLRRAAPLPLDVLARGVARMTLEPRQGGEIYYAGDLRRRSTRGELRDGYPTDQEIDALRGSPAAATIPESDREIPFGWTPGDRP